MTRNSREPARSAKVPARTAGRCVEPTQPLPNTAGMPRKPEQLKSWTIYKVAAKAIWLGTVEAPDKRTAIEKGAKEFKMDAWRLYAVPLR